MPNKYNKEIDKQKLQNEPSYSRNNNPNIDSINCMIVSYNMKPTFTLSCFDF